MRKFIVVMSAVCFLAGVALVGCGPKRAASSRDAIDASKVMQTVDEKVDYLMGQANAFYNSKEYDQAIEIAQYVLAGLDKNSTAAKDLITKAKGKLAALAEQKADELKGKVSGMLK